MINWIDEANHKNKTLKEVMSFHDYMEYLEKNMEKQCRPTFEYLLDMFNHFGKDSNDCFKLFQIEHPDSPAVFGQQKTQAGIYENLKTFQKEGFNNKFILLVGPNGSSKSSLVKKIMKGAEEYSMLDDGALYTFSWVFPIDTFVKGSLGLASKHQKDELNSYAYLEDKDITAILTSELKDHPILLIPREHREKILEEGLKDNPALLESVKKSYLYQGAVSKRNNMIYEALLKNYQGDHSEVLKHIRVERFNISKRYSTGAVTIEPQLHIDAKLQQITMDKRLATLPPSLQSLNLFSLSGEAILANRGVLEFSDLLKRPLDAYKYLLMTMETGTLNLQGILTELDIFFIGTSNEIHFEGFKQHPDFKSFTGRFNFIKVPYLLNYHDEEHIYENQIAHLKEQTNFEPHALTTLCLFAIMTRIRTAIAGNYSKEQEKLSKIATSLNPLEKAVVVAGDALPERFDMESKQILKHGLAKIISEFERDNIYEGKFGISPRTMKSIIYQLSSEHNNITVVEIIEFLQNFIQAKGEHDFLNMAPQGDYHNPTKFIELLTNHMMDIFDKELRDSLGLVDNRSYEDHTKKYIQNINALIKGEKIKNEITGKFEPCDEFFIKEFEKSINLSESADNFRSHLISKLGAYYLDNPNKTIVYCEVFPDVIDRLQQSFKEEQNKIIKSIANNIVYYEAERGQKDDKKKVSTPLSKENREEIKTVIDNLASKYNYSEAGAMGLVKYIVKNRY